MTYAKNYWRHDHEAPFANLLRILNLYCHPEHGEYDDLKELARNPEQDSRMGPFKGELREALADPSLIPNPDALSYAAEYDDGSPERFLRRLWRDLYPDEPVPGGDEEFRDDLRKLTHGEVDKVPSTVDYYDENWHQPKTPDGLKALGREVWAKFYPDEPLP